MATFASMERIDPLRSDSPGNWQTNLGIVTYGLDSDGRALRATAGQANSPTLVEMHRRAEVDPTSYSSGEIVQAVLEVATAGSTATGLPAIHVTQSDGVEVSTIDVRALLHGYYQEGSYVLEIDSALLKPREYFIWIILDPGQVFLVPILVSGV